MAKKIQAIRGMNDNLPANISIWQKVESSVQQVLSSYGYSEIRMPIVEMTSLFKRAIGEVTDVVEKEMYTFDDRNGDSLTLRPEGTAGCVRAGIEHGLLYNQQQRLWYMGPMFRHERPQKGRYRQFHQIGVEVFGLEGADIEAELIVLTARLWKDLGILDHVTLELNSIGSVEARKAYREALISYLEQYKEQLDQDALNRLYTNPLRILDSKNQQVQDVLVDAPKLSDYLDDDAKEHFAELRRLLDELGIKYQLNERLVRGLDYYNKTVFEWTTKALGAQGTICAGGRYDGLVEQLGGKPAKAVGFAMGVERLVLMLETLELHKTSPAVDVYFVTAGEGTLVAGMKLAEEIRTHLPQLNVMTHFGGGNFKKQFKRADNVGASIALVLGENELAEQQIVIKDLRQGEQKIVLHSELISELNQLNLK